MSPSWAEPNGSDIIADIRVMMDTVQDALFLPHKVVLGEVAFKEYNYFINAAEGERVQRLYAQFGSCLEIATMMYDEARMLHGVEIINGC